MTQVRQADAIVVSVCVSDAALAPCAHVHFAALDGGGVVGRAMFTPRLFALLLRNWSNVVASRALGGLTVTTELDTIRCSNDPAPCVAKLRSSAIGALFYIDFVDDADALVASARVPVEQLVAFIEHAGDLAAIVARGGFIAQLCEVAA